MDTHQPAVAIDPGGPGPRERHHLNSPAFRNVAGGERLTRTHWHIAWANGLGWGFDGMDGAIFSLVSPMVIKEFGIGVADWRTGLQLVSLVGIGGLYLWPWLADRYGRRNILALNIAMFSVVMPLVALAPGWGSFIAAYAMVRFALTGEWAVGSMLVAETWPARLRGLIVSVDRSAWGVGAAMAGGIIAYITTVWGWRAAFVLPAVVALLAVYVRLLCPESPYWVRTQDRRDHINGRIAAGVKLSEEESAWVTRAGRPGLRQLFLPDMLPSTAMATFVATMSLLKFSTVGYWMPLFLAQSHGWQAAEYGSFYIWWGLVGVTGLCFGGWIIDRLGRRPGIVLLLLEATVFMTLWIYAESDTALWIYGLLWGWGFLGVWGPCTTYTSEIYPTRIRGVGNGFSWGVAYFVGYVLWPFVTVWLRDATGSFKAAFLTIPVIMLVYAAVVWLYSPEHRGKDLDLIHI